jgi:hypothetical protein
MKPLNQDKQAKFKSSQIFIISKTVPTSSNDVTCDARAILLPCLALALAFELSIVRKPFIQKLLSYFWILQKRSLTNMDINKN